MRGTWAALIAGLLNQCHSLADVVRLLKIDKETCLVCGFSKDDMPGEDALSRFLKKLVKLPVNPAFAVALHLMAMS